MALTDEMIREIRESWDHVAADADGTMRLFYQTLFEIAPEVAEYFDGLDMAAQRRKLAAALGLVVRHADSVGGLVPQLNALGATHARKGVQPAHYDAVGAALLKTLETGLGPAFTEATRAAWATAYSAVAGAMIDGAAAPLRRSA
jgi:hemoglobin-like flavoprotein